MADLMILVCFCTLQHSDKLIFWNKRKRRFFGPVFVSICCSYILTHSVLLCRIRTDVRNDNSVVKIFPATSGKCNQLHHAYVVCITRLLQTVLSHLCSNQWHAWLPENKPLPGWLQVILGQTLWALVGVSKKIQECWGPALWDGASLTPYKHVPPHMDYTVKFDCCWSDSTMGYWHQRADERQGNPPPR